MTEKDWKEIRELRLQFMGTSKGIALGNLIAEKQRLDQIRQIVKDWQESLEWDIEMHDTLEKIQKVLEQE